MLHRKTLLPIFVLTALLGVGANLVAHNDKRVRKVFEGKLANVPGHTLTAEVVDFPQGYKIQRSPSRW